MLTETVKKNTLVHLTSKKNTADSQILKIIFIISESAVKIHILNNQRITRCLCDFTAIFNFQKINPRVNGDIRIKI